MLRDDKLCEGSSGERRLRLPVVDIALFCIEVRVGQQRSPSDHPPQLCSLRLNHFGDGDHVLLSDMREDSDPADGSRAGEVQMNALVVYGVPTQ